MKTDRILTKEDGKQNLVAESGWVTVGQQGGGVAGRRGRSDRCILKICIINILRSIRILSNEFSVAKHASYLK